MLILRAIVFHHRRRHCCPGHAAVPVGGDAVAAAAVDGDGGHHLVLLGRPLDALAIGHLKRKRDDHILTGVKKLRRVKVT